MLGCGNSMQKKTKDFQTIKGFIEYLIKMM